MKNELCNKIRFYAGQLPPDGILVAVSKTKPAEMIRAAYDCPHLHFGENKVQEMKAKHEILPPDIHWHMIGHLQTNKVKYIAPFVWLIHSVDREKLLREIDKQAAKHKRIIPVLFQIKIAKEETKFGLTEADYQALVEKYLQNAFPHIRLQGLMGMASLTDDKDQIRREFRRLRRHFEALQKHIPDIRYLSMGMTGDYRIALDEGANIIRIGSGIFGERYYPAT